jgi:hypothetical protein
MGQKAESSNTFSNHKSQRRRTVLTILSAVFILLIAVVVLISVRAPLNPITSTIKTIGFAVTGRLHLPAEHIGNIVTSAEGEGFTIFREVVVDPTSDQPGHPGAILTIHFKVTNMSPQLNQLYSLVPLPLYIGYPGFRSKLFTINGEDCQSIYAWDSVQEAQNYVNSVALKTILMRAVPGSVHWEIVLPTK